MEDILLAVQICKSSVFRAARESMPKSAVEGNHRKFCEHRTCIITTTTKRCGVFVVSPAEVWALPKEKWEA